MSVWIHCLDKMGKLGIVVVVLMVGAMLVPITAENILGLIFTSSVKKNDIFRSANKNFTTLWAMRQKKCLFFRTFPWRRSILYTYTLQFYIKVLLNKTYPYHGYWMLGETFENWDRDKYFQNYNKKKEGLYLPVLRNKGLYLPMFRKKGLYLLFLQLSVCRKKS